mgnify:CR=1 FL=1
MKTRLTLATIMVLCLSAFLQTFAIGKLIPCKMSKVQAFAMSKWYNSYEQGLELVNKKQYQMAISKFNEALKARDTDTQKIRTYGMHFIEYFPHREKGICFYYLGEMQQAQHELQLSMRQQYSARAQQYLTKIQSGSAVEKPPPPAVIIDKEPIKREPEPIISQPEPPTVAPPVKLVGERMGIAVLPFQTKGLGEEMGEINIVEQMMTIFYNLNRFKLYERTQLEKILEEQQLGMAGVIDASTAAEIGKGIGVDAIVLGTVTRSGSSLAIDARLIDTGTSEIITAQDDMSHRTNITELRAMINRLATKIINDLPLVEGYVIGVNGDQLMLDMGRKKNVKKGMKCIVYREGREIIHPITKKVLGKETEELGEVKLIEVYPEYSIGKVLFIKSGMFELGNRAITK